MHLIPAVFHLVQVGMPLCIYRDLAKQYWQLRLCGHIYWNVVRVNASVRVSVKGRGMTGPWSRFCEVRSYEPDIQGNKFGL
jgi:hypothetical protein